jgi:hypothetical protein
MKRSDPEMYMCLTCIRNALENFHKMVLKTGRASRLAEFGMPTPATTLI